MAALLRRRLVVAWCAFAVAGLGFAAHPTGFILFAPLVAGLPLLWGLVRLPEERVATALRALAVASGGMVAPLMAFVDGGLRDFLRGQALFLSIQAQENWTTEFLRYEFLLSPGPMGNYARLRRLHLAEDQTVLSTRLWPDHRGDAFTPHAKCPLARLPRNAAGDVVLSATSDEARPQDAA